MSQLPIPHPPTGGVIDVVLDTDTYNEIDDQFAVVYAILSADRLNLQAIYAAPFDNGRSKGSGDGMERSHEEIMRLLERLEPPAGMAVCRGATQFVREAGGPVENPATLDLIERVRARDPKGPPLYIATIGAPTNVASALLLAPEIKERVVVVWLGGQPHHWPTAREFNLFQDLDASRVLFDSGVPLVQIPCQQVAEQLRTTRQEVADQVRPHGEIGQYLDEIFGEFVPQKSAQSKVIWDISAIAWLIQPEWTPDFLTHSPRLSDDFSYIHDNRRHLIRVVREVRRDLVFRDLFTKLAENHG